MTEVKTPPLAAPRTPYGERRLVETGGPLGPQGGGKPRCPDCGKRIRSPKHTEGTHHREKCS